MGRRYSQNPHWGRSLGSGGLSPPQKILNFSLGMVYFGAFWAVLFVCVIARKNVEFSA